MKKESITIKKIHIENIFDMYDYDIDLNYDGNVSYLIAPNGFGKTTIIKMIDFIYRPFLYKNANLLDIPFTRMDCEMTDGKHVGIEKRNIKDTALKKEKTYKYSSLPIGDAIDMVLYGDERLFINYDGNEVDCADLLEECLSSQSFSDAINSEKTESSQRKEERLLYQLNFEINRKIKAKQEEFGCINDVTFIKADRITGRMPILGNYSTRNITRPYDNALDGMRRRVYAELTRMTRRYSQNLNAAKDQFLSNIIESDEGAMNFADFIKEWNVYKETYKRFTDIGIIEASQNEKFLSQEISREKYEKKARELSSYIRAFSFTFDILENNYTYLKLLMDIFNERNIETGKKLVYQQGDMSVILKNGKELELEDLSSGEKNDLVMFYHLLFDTKDDTMVLIDEPEISLNINWQEGFGNYLQKICDLNNLHAIIATHSPHIINGRVEAITVIKGKELPKPVEKDDTEAEESSLDYDMEI